jgi:Tfp pilus assembly PilM family ATPase
LPLFPNGLKSLETLDGIMQHNIGISFSKNHLFLADIKQNAGTTSLNTLTSFSHHDNPIAAIRSNKAIFDTLLDKNSNIIVALPSHDILLKTITLDSHLTDNEIIQYIQSQSSTLFGFSIDQLAFDYDTLSHTEDQQQIMVAATYRSVMHQFESVFKALKLPLHAIDVDAFALTRLHFLMHKTAETNLLMQQNDEILIIHTRHGKPQKKAWMDVKQIPTQFHTLFSTNNTCVGINISSSLKALLAEQGVDYQDIHYPSLNAVIQNKSNTRIENMLLSFVAIGAALWSSA